MSKSTCAPANVSPLDVLGELCKKWVPIVVWGDRILIYVALVVFAGCAFSCRGNDEYFGKWHSPKNDENGISFNFEFSKDNKIHIIMTNKTEVIELVGNITMTSYLNHEYLLNYKLISATKTTNGVKSEDIEAMRAYYYCVCKIENGKLIIKVDGASTPDDKIRPKLDGAIPPLVLVRDEK